MPPRRKKQTNTMTFSLQQAHDYINNLPNAENSKYIWNSALTTLVHYDEEGDVAENTTLTKAELFEKHKDIDIVPLITNADKVIDIVSNQIVSSRTMQQIQLETQKSYYVALIRLTQRGSPLQIPKETRNIYNDKLAEIGKASNDTRNLNEPKRANLLYPNFTWTVAQDEYEKFITEHAFTNTQKGMKELRIACAVGLYVLQRPRRIQDYCTLQWFSRKPAPRDMENRNILYADGDNLVLSIDRFKTRYRVAGGATEKKELLPRYVKTVNPRLADLFRDYVKKAKIKDMTKLTVPQRRAGVNYYIFVKDNDEEHTTPYDENTFSKFMTASFKYVFQRNKLSVNTFRHIFNTWVAENIQLFNDKKLQEIAIDVGDSPKNLPTNLRYRVANQEVAQMAKTEIDGVIAGNEYAKNLMIAGAEEEGSVGNVGDGGNVEDVAEVADADEVVSPTPRQVPKTDNAMVGAGVVDEDLKVLYERLGEATMQVELIKSMIAKKLNF